jgi:hypothetical protein
MSEAKFTKGEWWVNHTGKHHNNPEISQHEICYSKEGECVVDHVYDVNDAHLIAAAPEMYEMLNNILDERVGVAKNDYVLDDEIESLLAKARGEQL